MKHDALDELIAIRLRLLGQPTRVRLLRHVQAKDYATMDQLANVLGTTQQNVSGHLRLLFRGGVLKRETAGTLVRYTLADQSVVAVLDNAAIGITRRLEELAQLVNPNER